ncbi:hypothetical protein AB1K70_03350 [Bremerella sp. JC770]|uniref:hypothetical protein n=1 Tax=Bremerella sp. JC770 TaxID=3232137 RepID=UPI0034586CF6
MSSISTTSIDRVRINTATLDTLEQSLQDVQRAFGTDARVHFFRQNGHFFARKYSRCRLPQFYYAHGKFVEELECLLGPTHSAPLAKLMVKPFLCCFRRKCSIEASKIIRAIRDKKTEVALCLRESAPSYNNEFLYYGSAAEEASQHSEPAKTDLTNELHSNLVWGTDDLDIEKMHETDEQQLRDKQAEFVDNDIPNEKSEQWRARFVDILSQSTSHPAELALRQVHSSAKEMRNNYNRMMDKLQVEENKHKAQCSTDTDMLINGSDDDLVIVDSSLSDVEDAEPLLLDEPSNLSMLNVKTLHQLTHDAVPIIQQRLLKSGDFDPQAAFRLIHSLYWTIQRFQAFAAQRQNSNGDTDDSQELWRKEYQTALKDLATELQDYAYSHQEIVDEIFANDPPDRNTAFGETLYAIDALAKFAETRGDTKTDDDLKTAIQTLRDMSWVMQVTAEGMAPPESHHEFPNIKEGISKLLTADSSGLVLFEDPDCVLPAEPYIELLKGQLVPESIITTLQHLTCSDLCVSSAQ